MTPLMREREARGWKRSQVYLPLAIDRSNYRKMELGTILPTAELAARIAALFGHAITEMQILYPDRYPILRPSGTLTVEQKAS